MSLNDVFNYYGMIFIKFEIKISKKTCLVVEKSRFLEKVIQLLNSTNLEYITIFEIF